MYTNHNFITILPLIIHFRRYLRKTVKYNPSTEYLLAKLIAGLLNLSTI